MDEHALYTAISRRIKQARMVADMTQQELAFHIGVSRVSVTTVENGALRFSLPRLCKVAEVLRVSPEWLVFGKGFVDAE